MTALSELIARLEKATDADLDLDKAIALAVGARTLCTICNEVHDAPGYTWSVDAALSLVPEGWTVASISQQDNKAWFCELREGFLTSYNKVVMTNYGRDCPPTPALAICIASLKARAA